MKVKVTSHRLWGRRDVLNDVRALAQPCAALVEANIGRLPHCQIIVTSPDGMLEQELRAETALVGRPPADTTRQRLRQAARSNHGLFGLVVPESRNRVVVLLNAHKLHRSGSGSVPVTLIHELTHAAQLNRRGAVQEHVDYVRHAFDIAPLSPRELRIHERLSNDREAEAYRAETALTPLLGSLAA
ncbi:hypothetical protein AB0C77_01475 [Streptomyces sp. NPDC048629]|uniref:hypothetical protein n=1 Tax=Streptomyces sp. NPDC048629 TaxID=3154824 RepID=UPI0034486750